MTKMTNRFKRGSGCYRCRCCGRMTRETGHCESGCGLCSLCFEAGGIENQIADYGDPDGKLQKEIDDLNARCRELGGNP